MWRQLRLECQHRPNLEDQTRHWKKTRISPGAGSSSASAGAGSDPALEALRAQPRHQRGAGLAAPDHHHIAHQPVPVFAFAYSGAAYIPEAGKRNQGRRATWP